jgi:hypothetical protein
MATATKAPVELTILQQIEQGIEILREKRAESRTLQAQAAELAASGDVEGSIRAEERAAAVSKFCVRQKTIVEEKIRARHSQQLAEYWKRIDELYERLSAEAKAAAEQLRKAGAEVYAALLRMREINGGGLSGAEVLQSVPTTNFEHQISQILGGALTGLARGVMALRQHAQNRDYFPGGPQGWNLYDAAMFASLRTAMGGDLELERWDLEEEPEEPVAAAEVTN